MSSPQQNNSNPSNQSNNQPYPPYPYPPYPYPPYPYPNPNQNPNSNQQQPEQPNFPYPYPYPPYPYPNPNQNPNPNSNPNSNSNEPQSRPPQPDQVNLPFPYPPYPPYPYPNPNQPYPPYPYPPYSYSSQQMPQQQPRSQFDWERNGMPNSNTPTSNQPSSAAPGRNLFDWEKGISEPQKEITIDWNYKSEYDVPEVIPEFDREPSVSVICTSKTFNPSVLPNLDDSFYNVSLGDIRSSRKTFSGQRKSNRKEKFVIKFTFDQNEISDLSVSATFHFKEYTCSLYNFLNEFVFKEGTKFGLRDPIGKKILSNQNQRLCDVNITGNIILSVKITQYTGIKDEIQQQYLTKKNALEEAIAEPKNSQ